MIDVVAEIAAQLAWRGPSGKPLGHIVLDREQAQALLRMLDATSHPQQQVIKLDIPHV